LARFAWGIFLPDSGARAPILLLLAAKEALLLGFWVRDGENRRSELRRERRGANMRGSETCGDHNARIRLRVIAFSFCSFSFACISCVVSRFTDIYNFLTSLSKPIVAKQEKKKRPKGRAGKRIVYNRRFVNVVVGPGKKKSPNSNAA
jgi:small subunit ribosomal protein S30e